MADKTLRTILEAKVSGFKSGMTEAAGAARRTSEDIERTEDAIRALEDRLDALGKAKATPQVKAETEKAEADLETARKRLADLHGERATMELDADAAPLEDTLGDAEKAAEESGDEGGARMGKALIAALIAVFNLLLPYLIKKNLAVRQDSLPIRIFRRN